MYTPERDPSTISLRSVFLAHVSFRCLVFSFALMAPRGDAASSAQSIIPFPPVVPSIPASFSVHYARHPCLLARVAPSVSLSFFLAVEQNPLHPVSALPLSLPSLRA